MVVPDHMGFGKSETPQDRDYSIREHSENLTALLLHLDLRDLTLVVQDWGGPIGAQVAYRHPDRVKRLVVILMLVAKRDTGRKLMNVRKPLSRPRNAFSPSK